MILILRNYLNLKKIKKWLKKPEVAVWETNTINIKHVESDLKMFFDETDFSVETEEEFEKTIRVGLKPNLIDPYIRLLRF